MNKTAPLHDLSELQADVATAAKRLLGCILTANIEGKSVRLRIVETEAYDQTDAASHSYNGITDRTQVMFGPAGRLYVYFTYGMHYCCNIVVGAEGFGSAVLIRAVEPLDSHPLLSIRRGMKGGIEITNGPAKVCQALAITLAMNGHDLSNRPLQLSLTERLDETGIVSSPRVGISRAQDVLWRFYIKDNLFVSSRASRVRQKLRS